MPKILLGTTSQSKLEIVKSLLCSDCKIIPVDVESDIANQPLDERTTIKGAINRAKNAAKTLRDYDFSVGLEGGLEKINNLYYLICAVAIADQKGNIFIGISNKLPLPKKVSKRIAAGEQFGEVIREFMKDLQSSPLNSPPELIQHIQELIDRKESFSIALKTALLALKFSEKFV